MARPARWLAALLLLAGSAHAAAPERRLAVLEFQGKIGTDVLAAMADEARAGALEAVQPAGYVVITRESMALILREMGGPKTTDCVEGECEVDTARNIGADLVVTGEVAIIDAAYLLTLKLHETVRGALLASRSIDDVAQLELVRKVRAASRALLRDALGLGAVEGHVGPVGDIEEVAVQFESEPAGAVVRVDGRLLCQSTPCSRRVAVGRHQVTMERERFLPASGTLEARRGARLALRLGSNLGWITIESQPSGMLFSINGKEAGRAPLQRRELEAGMYEVLAEEPCYERTGERIKLERGEAQTVRLRPSPLLATVMVDAQDDRGNAIDGEVWANGASVGPTGRALRVPLCTRELKVIARGQTWTGAVHLDANETTRVTAVVGNFGRWVPDSPPRGSLPAPEPTPPAKVVEEPRGFPTLGVALFLAGVAAGIGGTLWAESIHDDVKKMPPGAGSTGPAITRGKIVNGLAIAGWVTGGLGAVLVVARW